MSTFKNALTAEMQAISQSGATNSTLGGYQIPLFDANGTLIDRQTITKISSVVGASKDENELLVDLGLPSGLMWATRNLDVTRQNGFAESVYQYECSFFSWGNTFGINPKAGVTSGTNAFVGNYDWGTTNDGTYADTYGASITATTFGGNNCGLGNDAARMNLGGNWRLPTTEEFSELYSNCDTITSDGTVLSSTDRRTTVNGITGLLLRSKINGKRLFFPCSGNGNGSSWNNRGANGVYWSSSLYSASQGRNLNFNSGGVNPQNNNNRFYGFAVRAVQ